MDQREGQTFNTALISWKAPQLPVRGADPMLSAPGPEIGQTVSPSVCQAFLLCTLCWHAARYGTDPSCSLGIFMQDAAVWFRNGWFLSLLPIVLRQMLKRVCVGYFSPYSHKWPQHPGQEDSRKQDLLRVYFLGGKVFWSSHNANTVAYSRSLKFNCICITTRKAWVSVQSSTNKSRALSGALTSSSHPCVHRVHFGGGCLRGREMCVC